MDKSPLQHQIEKTVSGGLMRDSSTDFSKGGSVYDWFVDFDAVKNSKEGLSAHLYGLSKKEAEDRDVRLYSEDSSVFRKGCISLVWAGREVNYERKIRAAVIAEGKRRGGLRSLVKEKVGVFTASYLGSLLDE